MILPNTVYVCVCRCVEPIVCMCVCVCSFSAIVNSFSNSVVVQRKAEFHEHYAAGAIYVLSMAWFREWENFVCCKTNGLVNYVHY